MKPTRVDFYLLADTQPEASQLLACRLVEKAYILGHKVFIYCADEAQAAQMDALLWAFRYDSFVPHVLQHRVNDNTDMAVHIGALDPGPDFQDVLINLSADIASFYARFQQVVELVDNKEDAKAQSRDHYRRYRKEGCELHSHSVDTTLWPF